MNLKSLRWLATLSMPWYGGHEVSSNVYKLKRIKRDEEYLAIDRISFSPYTDKTQETVLYWR